MYNNNVYGDVFGIDRIMLDRSGSGVMTLSSN